MSGIFDDYEELDVANRQYGEIIRWPSFDHGCAVRAYRADLIDSARMARLTDFASLPEGATRFFASKVVEGGYLAHFKGPGVDWQFDLEEGRPQHRFYVANSAKRTLMLGSQKPVSILVGPGVSVWFDDSGVPVSHWEEAGRGAASPAHSDHVTWLEVPGHLDAFESALASAMRMAAGDFDGLADPAMAVG